jgi:hypothetical protein
MSDDRQEQSEVKVSLSRGKEVEVQEEGHIVKYRFVDGDGLLLTIKRVTTRKGTSIRAVETVGFEFRPDTPFDTDVDLREWAVVGYCRFGASQMMFDSGEFEGNVRMSPRDTHTEIRLDATFTSPRIDLLSRRRHVVRMDFTVPTPRSMLITG